MCLFALRPFSTSITVECEHRNESTCRLCQSLAETGGALFASVYGGQRRQIGTLTVGRGKARGERAGGGGGTESTFLLCHTPKCMQLASLSFQFPFGVNTEQSRWRYDWLNWTRLSKYYMTSHKLLGVIQTYTKCCCRQLCAHFPHVPGRTHTQGHLLKNTLHTLSHISGFDL